MPSSPRHFAETIFARFMRLPSEHRSSAAFLDIAEATIKEAIAYELHWLAEYLESRAKQDMPEPRDQPREVRPEQLPGSPPSLS